MAVQRLKPTGGATIKSIQRGTVAGTASFSAATATITSVNTATTSLSLLGAKDDAGTPGAMLVRVELTNATTVTGHYHCSNNGTIGFEVVEWQQ